VQNRPGQDPAAHTRANRAAPHSGGRTASLRAGISGTVSQAPAPLCSPESSRVATPCSSRNTSRRSPLPHSARYDGGKRQMNGIAVIRRRAQTRCRGGALPARGGLHGRCVWRAERANIPHWRPAEEAAVFAVELAGAFVSDLEGGACGIEAVHEHPSPRRL